MKTLQGDNLPQIASKNVLAVSETYPVLLFCPKHLILYFRHISKY